MHELIVDSFAGGGGASTGIEMALGRSPDYAINHDREALALHAANHPDTVHLSENIYKVDPMDVVGRRPVGLLWASPDCKHFSKAKGGAPVKRDIRDLAWTVVLWAKRAKPLVIILENVEEFQGWGPLVENDKGELMPCPDRRGETFTQWVKALEKLGYKVEYRELRACDFGAPTTRKRLFVIARRDGRKIVWPEPTHAVPGKDARLLPYRTAASDVIDWSIPCPSIFDTSAEIMERFGVRAVRPLAEATLARIAKGVKRYVIDAAKPFIVNLTHGVRLEDADQPFQTITGAHRGEKAVVVPHITKFRNGAVHAFHGEGGGSADRSADPAKPINVIDTANRHAVVAAFLAQHNAGPRPGAPGHSADEPTSSITATGSQQAIVSAGLMNMKGSDRASWPVDGSTPTQTAGGQHVAEVRAFLLKYYGNEIDGHDPANPLGAVTTRDRFGLVTVEGEPYQIVDIGMRMLTPRELFKAQGFPADYEIETGVFEDGTRRALTKTAQVRMCGNSVCPPIAAALVSANCNDLAVANREAAE